MCRSGGPCVKCILPSPVYNNYALGTGKPDYHAIHIGPPKCLIWYANAVETCSAPVGRDPVCTLDLPCSPVESRDASRSSKSLFLVGGHPSRFRPDEQASEKTTTVRARHRRLHELRPRVHLGGTGVNAKSSGSLRTARFPFQSGCCARVGPIRRQRVGEFHAHDPNLHLRVVLCSWLVP